MDVRCERCSTEYEFDDALVSGRGTTVKCTNCGHKFKIRRSDGDFSEDFWNIQTGDGRTLVFTSLRELQRAIQTNLVDRHDLLSRGGLKQKAIGQIPELAPFFDQRDLTQQRKSLPPAPPAEAVPAGSSGASRPTPGVSTPPGAPRQRMSTRPDYPPAVPSASAPASLASMKRTLIGTGQDDQHEPTDIMTAPPSAPVASAPVASAPVASAPVASAPPAPHPRIDEELGEAPPPTERDVDPQTERFDRAPPPVASRPSVTRTQPIDPVYVPTNTPPPPAFEASSPLPPPAPPVARRMSVDVDAYEEQGRGRAPSLADSLPPHGKRRSVGGFVVAVVVVAGVALLGVVWAKDNLRDLLGGRPAPVVTSDPRVAAFLETGEQALAAGNLELAKESFDKASALAEKDPRVLLDAARLAAVRADTPWLKARLLAPDAADEHRLAKAELAERGAAARKAADAALGVAPDDPAALRAKIDALRISGDREGARALVAKVATSAMQPETAYVLAALDLAEDEPLWSTVIERLRIAASTESGPGRARASLAYALARSGDALGAKAEVERLAAMSRQHPLLPLLRAFAEHAESAAVDAGPDVADGGGPALTKDGKRVRGDKGGRAPSDARQLVSQGEAARAKGDLTRAQTLFSAALDRNPNDTEALSGLAAIAHSRRDLNGARASYKRVLSINPSYVPALVGVGDVDWESGDRTSAMKTYKEIVDRFPEGSYPARVRQRVEGAGSTAPSAAPPASAPVPVPVPVPSDTGGGG
jgi:predicted Zn finger-like uncharacterized protein